jgi:hypothetical protein
MSYSFRVTGIETFSNEEDRTIVHVETTCSCTNAYRNITLTFWSSYFDNLSDGDKVTAISERVLASCSTCNMVASQVPAILAQTTESN